MAPRIRLSLAVLLLWLTAPGAAVAGMPSFTLGDLDRVLTLTRLTRMRLEAISFFLVALLLCAGIVQGIWNSFRKDFPRLPRLSYAKAFGVLVLWGMLFVLVLTMVSGARELMTPGAWKKKGLTYELNEDSAQDVEEQINARYRAIARIRDGLASGSHFDWQSLGSPASTKASRDLKSREPGSSGPRYIYVGGPMISAYSFEIPKLMVYEGDAFGQDRLVVMTDGSITWMPASEIERLVRPGAP